MQNNNKNIHVLHVAMEYAQATLGGLGSVVTQLVSAQNQFRHPSMPNLSASIITPFYEKLFCDHANCTLIATVEHLFDSRYVKSSIYLYDNGINRHYFAEPDSHYRSLFDIPAITYLYNDLADSRFLDRIKYFNAAVAAFLGTTNIDKSHSVDILQLHDWQAALVPKLLKSRYNIFSLPSMFIVHIGNIDNGTYLHKELDGVGLEFAPGYHCLKAIGLVNADKIVAVSPSFLQRLSATNGHNQLHTIFLLDKAHNKKSHAIINGINYRKYCPLYSLIADPANVYGEKQKLKLTLAALLQSKNYNFDPNLPLILYVGRFSKEKGVDTFAAVIKTVAGRANFIALGRGMCKSVHRTTRKNPALLISNNQELQTELGSIIRACADFMFVPSLQEACGLVPMEGYANGAACISSSALSDSLIVDKSFVFKVDADIVDETSMLQAISTALSHWESMDPKQRNIYQTSIMQEAQKFDWLAPQGAVFQYADLMRDMLHLDSPKSRLRFQPC